MLKIIQKFDSICKKKEKNRIFGQKFQKNYLKNCLVLLDRKMNPKLSFSNRSRYLNSAKE